MIYHKGIEKYIEMREIGFNPKMLMAKQKETQRRTTYNAYFICDGELYRLFADEYSNAIGMSRELDLLFYIFRDYPQFQDFTWQIL